MSTLNHGKKNMPATETAETSATASAPAPAAPAAPRPPDWTAVVAAGPYHAAARSGAFMSASMLREFRLCPAGYRDIISGRAPTRASHALRFGSAAHTLILEGEAAYSARYNVGGPTNPATGRSFTPDSKAFARWLAGAGLPAEQTLTPAEDELLRRMADAVRRHPEAAALLAAGWPERTVRAAWEDVACQARLDWLRPDGQAVDLKTVADLSRFELDAQRFGYLHQFAFYRDVVRSAGGADMEISAVVVEKKAPFRVGVWRFPARALAPAAERNRSDIERLRRCRETGVWPTGYETARLYPGGAPAFWMN